MEPLNQDLDEAIDRWGAAADGTDPLEASFTIEPFSPVRPHVPFYRFFSYPDILDLRKAGYEVEAFIPVFDALENALYSQALKAHNLLHRHDSDGNPIWNPRRARELEFEVRADLHRFGLSEVPTLLRRMLGRAFPDDLQTHLAIDLLHIFFWAAMGQVAADYAWRSPRLASNATYLRYPYRVIGFES